MLKIQNQPTLTTYFWPLRKFSIGQTYRTSVEKNMKFVHNAFSDPYPHRGDPRFSFCEIVCLSEHCKQSEKVTQSIGQA